MTTVPDTWEATFIIANCTCHLCSINKSFHPFKTIYHQPSCEMLSHSSFSKSLVHNYPDMSGYVSSSSLHFTPSRFLLHKNFIYCSGHVYYIISDKKYFMRMCSRAACFIRCPEHICVAARNR